MILIDNIGKEIEENLTGYFVGFSIIHHWTKNFRPDITALILNHDSFVHDKGRILDLKVDSSLFYKYPIKLIIVDCSKDVHDYDYSDLSNINFNVPILALTGIWNKSDYPCVSYFPYWLLAAVNFKIWPTTNWVDRFERKYLLSCMNRKLIGRAHRIYNIVQLLKRDYKEKIYYTLYEQDIIDDQSLPIHYSETLPDEVVNDFNNIIKDRPLLSQLNDWLESLSRPGHYNAYLNLVTETEITNSFVSEKSFKPLLAGQIPIYLGFPGLARFMCNLGFDLFYDIVDHDYYDNELDWKERVHKIHDLINSLKNLNFKEVFYNTKQRRIHNCNLLLSKDFHNEMLCPTFNKINQLLD